MKRGRRAAPGGPVRRGPRRAQGRRWIAWAVVAIGLAVVAWWTFGRRQPPAPPPAADLQGAAAAYQRGLDLAAAGRYRESIPDFRLAVEARPDVWNFHHDYASALLSTAHEGRSHQGRLEFVMRSSIERVALIREGLAELEMAQRLAQEPRGRAQIHRTRAQIFKAWGLAWNSFESYRASEWSDTTWQESIFLANDFMDLMENPGRARE